MSLTNGVLTVLPAPEGYVVDFAHPQRVGDIAGYWVTGVGLAVSTSFLAMRLYTKAFITKSLSIDDITLVGSFCFGVAVQALLLHLWAVQISGVHAWEMPMTRYQTFNILIMVASILYVPTLGLAKFSILFLYRKLAQLRWFRICIYVLMAIVISYSIGIMCALIFPCTPIESNWNLSVSGKCIDKAGIYLATAAVNVITDFMILTLPIPMVFKLNMPRSKKIGLAIVFIVGSATLVTSIVRLVLMIPMVKNFDQTWVVSVPCIWINIEANLAIVCVSLPTLRPFVKHIAPKLFGDESAANSDGPSYIKKNADIHTFGSGPISRAKKSKYGRMDDSVLEMTGNFDDLKTEAKDSTAEFPHPDDGSERAIWQTRTVTVSHGPR